MCGGWSLLFRDVVLPSGAAAAVCLSVLCAACLSAEDEASIPCNSFEYWSGQKSINTVSQATMQATNPGLFRLKNDSYYFFIFFALFSCKNARFFVRWFCYVYLRLAQENTISKPSGCVTACA